MDSRVPRMVVNVGLTVAVALLPGLAVADGSWLDGPVTSWNRPGADIPTAPPMHASPNPQCSSQGRPAETDADGAVAGAGWTLYGSYEGGWGVMVVRGLSGYDGMCRPLGYQEFVFADGNFAGTLAPGPMDSRTDGAGDLARLQSRDQLQASFQRYGPNDALCCPSSTTSVSYSIDRSGAAPVLVPHQS